MYLQTQTEAASEQSTEPLSALDTEDSAVCNQFFILETDVESSLSPHFQALLSFLRTVEADLCLQLQQNMRSRAFDGSVATLALLHGSSCRNVIFVMDAGYDVQWDEEVRTTTCQHVLTHLALLNKMECTGVSWNSSGSVIAVSYGHLEHDAWCTDKGFVCLVGLLYSYDIIC